MENVRLIHSVDKPSNLRTLVKQDLRELGIKAPKLKKTKRLNQSRSSSTQDGLLASGIFGNYLSFVPSTYVPDCGFVPKFLVDAAEIIEKQREVEGIFRKSGSISRQKDLKQQIEDGQRLESGSVHDMTGLVKQFFRELPEPLFTSVFHDSFVRCYNLAPPNQVEATLLLCLLLPMEHLSTLRFTMGLLSRLAAHSTHNKMDVGNLAVVLAPNIMHVNSRSQKMNSAEEKLLQIQTAIVELLIRNASSIGVVSESLIQRTALMTECFGTEDELEASDDNTLEDSKDIKESKKKRRKRSSSLQGLVSSIGRGFAKLRRNSEGKNNLTSGSNYSLANESELAPHSQSLSVTTHQGELSLPPAPPSATPVVMRKRKMSGEDVMPFSATKRKAILEQLPYKSALGATPFTPASSKKQMRVTGNETPNTTFTMKAQLAFSATPKPDSKSICKKLNLFSPNSGRKSKRSKSGGSGNLCGNPLRKSSRTKNFFKRRSSGMDKDDGEDSMDERQASPRGGPHSGSAMELTGTEGSPTSALSITRTVSSPSLHDLSTTSAHSPEDHNALNQGFIDPDVTACLDTTTTTTHIGAAPPGARGRSLKRADSFRPGERPVRRSASTDGALRRGQPNKLSNGLLEGKTENVKKLRRSFDKADIGHPIPIIVPVLPERNPVAAEGNLEVAIGSSRVSAFAQETTRHAQPRATLGTKQHVMVSVDKTKAAGSSSERSEKSREQGMDMESSLLHVVLPPPSGFGDQSIMEARKIGGLGKNDDDNGSDGESESGFSTISGGTVIHNPAATAAGCLNSLQRGESRPPPRSISYYGSSVSVNTPAFSLQPSTSADSLISLTGSESSATSTTHHHSRPQLDRSVSIDSGKGSLLDGTEVRSSSCRSLNTTFIKSSGLDPCSLQLEGGALDNPEPASSLHNDSRPVKSLSAEDLKSGTRMERLAARSHSMYLTGFGCHTNIVPNLQISAETHRLLTRAGFLDSSLPPNVKDVAVPFKSPQKGDGFSRDERLARSFRLERSATLRKERSNTLHVERVSPVKEETAQDQAEMLSEAAPHAGPRTKAVEATEEVWVRREPGSARAAELVNPGAETKTEEPPRPTVNLKRAELHMQKHESILHIKESNAGRVAQNVRQINSSLDRSALDQSGTSHHFQKCSPRKRGKSPVRIPTIFAKSTADPSATYYRDPVQKAPRKDGVSVPEAIVESGNGSAEEPESGSQSSPSRNMLSKGEGEEAGSTGETPSRPPKQRQLTRCSVGAGDIDLSSSLLETIEDALLPRRQKRRSHHREHSHSPLRESTNTKLSSTPPPPDDHLQLRTSRGLTPHQVARYGAKAAGSERSPGKPVKRLQQSPRSPHGRHSPHRRSPQKSRDRDSLRLESHHFHEQY